LQEADNCTARSGRLHISLELARELSFQYIHAASRLPKTYPQEAKQWYLDFEEIIGPDDPGDTGISFLSRFPVATAARIDLPWSDCPWRPRLALGASWSLGESAVQVFNAHIDPHAGLDGQLKQHEKILSHVSNSDGPVVLMGDFNTLTPKTRRETRLFLENRGFYTPMVNGASTWRTALFTNHTDWIFARNVRILRWGVGRALRSVSDHWPVWAEIALP
jgi:endonuclease/exonuclease/phosphatase family metal-dependent hydrolase